MALTNPFIQRGRITDPERFAGRWAELSLIFERLEAGRPVLVAGPPGVGKSSLLTHVVQSAAVNLELPELRAYYLNLAGAEGPAMVYRAVVEALGQRGDTPAALEVALLAAADPVLRCVDDAQAPIAAGWGEGLLEALARVARGGGLLLLAAVAGPAPRLSERFATINLGALAQTEVRLLIDSYLDDAGLSFTPAELRDIAELSAGHPAYVQRAAFHLFQSKLDPGVDWRAAYLVEARDRPIPGAPLPPAIFEGQGQGRLAQSAYGEEQYAGAGRVPQQLQVPETPPLLLFAIPLLGALLVLVLTGSPVAALLAGVVAAIGVWLWLRRKQ
jgi:Cdc6-like AAA superfamily ATPase